MVNPGVRRRIIGRKMEAERLGILQGSCGWQTAAKTLLSQNLDLSIANGRKLQVAVADVRCRTTRFPMFGTERLVPYHPAYDRPDEGDSSGFGFTREASSSRRASVSELGM
jgi:hypothetical protein